MIIENEETIIKEILIHQKSDDNSLKKSNCLYKITSLLRNTKKLDFKKIEIIIVIFIHYKKLQVE